LGFALLCRHCYRSSSPFIHHSDTACHCTPFLGFISNSQIQNEALVEEDAEAIELSEDLEEVEEEEEYDEEVIKEATQGDSSGKDTTSGNLEEEAEEEEEEAEAEEEVTEAKEETEREYDVSLKTGVRVFVVDGRPNLTALGDTSGFRFVFVDSNTLMCCLLLCPHFICFSLANSPSPKIVGGK
jgi:hypothetical protein